MSGGEAKWEWLMVEDSSAYGPLLERTTFAGDARLIKQHVQCQGQKCLTYRPCTQQSSEHLLARVPLRSSKNLSRQSTVSIIPNTHTHVILCNINLQSRVLLPDETTLRVSESGEASDVHERSRSTPRNSVQFNASSYQLEMNCTQTLEARRLTLCIRL